MTKHYSSPDFETINGLIYYNKSDTVVPVIPSSLVPEVLATFHDAVYSGHLGVDKTMDRVKKSAFFRNMRPQSVEYIATCDIC